MMRIVHSSPSSTSLVAAGKPPAYSPNDTVQRTFYEPPDYRKACRGLKQCKQETLRALKELQATPEAKRVRRALKALTQRNAACQRGEGVAGIHLRNSLFLTHEGIMEVTDLVHRKGTPQRVRRTPVINPRYFAQHSFDFPPGAREEGFYHRMFAADFPPIVEACQRAIEMRLNAPLFEGATSLPPISSDMFAANHADGSLVLVPPRARMTFARARAKCLLQPILLDTLYPQPYNPIWWETLGANNDDAAYLAKLWQPWLYRDGTVRTNVGGPLWGIAGYSAYEGWWGPAAWGRSDRP